MSALDNKGYSLFKLGRYNDAIFCANIAIKRQPTFANAWYNRGGYKIRNGDIKIGLLDLKKAIEISKEYINTAKQDPDLESVRDNKEFKKILGIENLE